MAMTRSLYSISALATELGRDRRTIAAALASVPADSRRGVHPAWFLSTALDALDPKRRPPAETVIDHLCARTDDWQEIHGDGKSAVRFPIDQAADLFGVDRDAVLTWLRAGMPYAAEGDWQSGDGFEIVLSWAMDWVVMAYGLAVHQGAETAAQRLRLPLKPEGGAP